MLFVLEKMVRCVISFSDKINVMLFKSKYVEQHNGPTG